VPNTRVALCGILILYLAQEAAGLNLRWVDDESWCLIPAKSLITEGRFRIPVFNDSDRDFWAAPPLLSVLEALSWRLRDLTIAQARLLTVAFGAGTILAAFALARRLFNDSVGVMAALLCAVENLIFLTGRTVRPEILATFFTVSALWLLLKAVQDGTKWPLVLAGLAVGAGMSSHPNGAVASLCGVALLWFFEGTSFLRRGRLYAFAFFCTLGFLPTVLFFIHNDSAGDFEGFHSLVALHARGGPSLLERWSRSLVTEATERYVAFSAFPYRLHLALLSLAAVVVSLCRRNRSARFLATCVLLHLAFFALVTKASKNPRYMTLVMPFVSMIWAEWLVKLWTERHWTGALTRLYGSGRARVLASLLFVLVGLSQIAGNAAYVWKYRHAKTEEVCHQIDALIPRNSTIYGGMAFWIGLNDHTYVPYMRMPWREALDEFHPNILILDDWVMVKGSYPGEWDALRAELHDYVDAHGKLLGEVPNDFYGDLKIYSVQPR
jgi:4-amino-4-deoxy-L-arabinose transferase-like glycosyltransferase